jgi:hypothetical protein
MLTFHRLPTYNVLNKRRIQSVILYVGSDYLSFIEWRNKWMWALTKSFQILDIFMNLQELFLNSYFKVVPHFHSFIVTFLQFISNVHHIKSYPLTSIVYVNNHWLPLILARECHGRYCMVIGFQLTIKPDTITCCVYVNIHWLPLILSRDWIVRDRNLMTTLSWQR